MPAGIGIGRRATLTIGSCWAARPATMRASRSASGGGGGQRRRQRHVIGAGRWSIATQKQARPVRTRATPDRSSAPSVRRLPLGSLRVFISVAHHLRFTRAADALGVTASAASLQIRSLEEYLARPLLRRNGRQVRLTAEGEALLPRVREALEQLERAVDDARGDRSAGPLRVSTLASFLQQWLLPRLQHFRSQYPEADLHLHTSDKIVDFVREDFHVAVRFGRGGWSNVHSEKLLDEWVLPVCAPALYRQFGPLRDADDLRRYPLLHSLSEPWTVWLFDGRRSDEVATLRGAVFDA